MSKKTTLKEIAQFMGVSVSTVSKALNDSLEISIETRNRVKEVALHKNYQPNYIAQSLKSKSTRTIGVIIPDILNYFFVKALSGIEKECRDTGYRIVTCISNESHDSEMEHIHSLANGSVDGLIISLSSETQRLNNYDHIINVLENNIPVVMFDRVAENLNCAKIISDNYQGAYAATEFLVAKGCRKLALFTTHIDLTVVEERKNGFLGCLKSNDLFDEKLVFNIENLQDEELIQGILESHDIDAVFSVDELLAIKIIKIAKKLNINIPENMKVIGFSDGELSREYSPSLTTVDLHPEKIGKLAITALIGQLKSDIKKKNVQEVKSTLIIRESV